MSSTEDSWTVGRLLSWTIDYLGKHGAENPRLEAELLLAHARNCRRIDLYTTFGDTASEDTRTAFRELVKRRAGGTPVAYLVGHREFYSLDFEVTPDVLIPRPETESLVVALLDRIKARGAGGSGLGTGKAGAETGLISDIAESRIDQVQATRGSVLQIPAPRPASPASLHIADVGTGSGILAVCAAKFVSAAHITAIDISRDALAVAKRNAERHNVADRIAFVESDLFAAITTEARFDFIVSNPPYVSTVEMQQLPLDVRDYEPEIALRAGENGTDVIAPLIEQSAERLKPGGGLFIEISPMIAEAVEKLVAAQPSLELGTTIKDLAGLARIVQATRRDC